VSALIAQTLITGIFVGGMYALWSFGLSLVWGVMKIINLAQGHFVLLASYISYWLWLLYGFDPIVSLVLTIPFMFLVGFGLFWLSIRRIFEKPNLLNSSMLVTWALAIIIETSILLFWGSDARSINTTYVGTSFDLGFAHLPVTGVIDLVCVAALLVILTIFLKKTLLGKAVRAVSQSIEGSKIVGIDVIKISAIAFGIAIASTAVAGSIVGITYLFSSNFATNWLGRIFVVVIIGGLGNLRGIITGGLILGLSEALVTVFFAAQWAPLIAYALLILILTLRPKGLFGEE
jgi:branched-chain amino acid transport system permease protein